MRYRSPCLLHFLSEASECSRQYFLWGLVLLGYLKTCANLVLRPQFEPFAEDCVNGLSAPWARWREVLAYAQTSTPKMAHPLKAHPNMGYLDLSIELQFGVAFCEQPEISWPASENHRPRIVHVALDYT